MQPEPRWNRGAWRIAWVLALMLHTVALVGLRRLPLSGSEKAVHRPEPIRLVFERSSPEKRRSEPHFFSELPPDRADSAPGAAAFLSNVTSRARDLVPGGDAAMPRLQGEGDAPTVKLESDDASPPAPSAPDLSARPAEPAAPRAAESPQRSGARPLEPSGNVSSGTASAAPGEPAGSRPRTSEPRQASEGPTGGSDMQQPEMANPYGNAPLTGDVSLNTIAWDYAPWLQRFSRQLVRRWIPPPAYSLGILKEGGWALVEVEISRSGQLLRFELLEEQGHPSLILAAQNALRYMAPIERLPAEFPEPTLILRVRMIYPRLRPR